MVGACWLEPAIKRTQRQVMGEIPRTPQALYFDTNILHEAGWPEPSARFLAVLDKAVRVGVCPAMVDLVCRELTEGWIRETVQKMGSLEDKIREFSRRVAGLCEVIERPALPSVNQMREHLAKSTEVLMSRFRRVPTSGQPAEYYMNLAMSRGGAFVEGGKGFNDTVVLVSIVEDMKSTGIEAALLVTGDKGFRKDGMKQVVGDAHLEIVRSIDEVDEVLDRLITERFREYLEEQKETLIAAVKARQDDLIEFVRQSLPSVVDDLNPVGRTRKVEFLGIIAYQHAFCAPSMFGDAKGGKSRLSVDLKIRARLETESFLFENRLARFDPNPNVIYPEDILVSSSDKEVVVTVEGDADDKGGVIEAIRFTSIHVKRYDRGLADLFLGAVKQASST